MSFKGTDSYVATEDLLVAVNAALRLERPLLIKGEPGTGKTVLATEVARSLGRPLIQWHIKSTTKAQQGLYEYDAVARLRDSQLGDARVHDISNYLVKGKLWEAFEAPSPPVLLIDEVDAFLRRCFFHYIRFPDRDTMERIVAVHFPKIKPALLHEALTAFFEIRDVAGLKKKPSTSELLDWIKLILAEDLAPEDLRGTDSRSLIPKLHGALLKNEQDVHLFERLAVMSRRDGR